MSLSYYVASPVKWIFRRTCFLRLATDGAGAARHNFSLLFMGRIQFVNQQNYQLNCMLA